MGKHILKQQQPNCVLSVLSLYKNQLLKSYEVVSNQGPVCKMLL